MFKLIVKQHGLAQGKSGCTNLLKAADFLSMMIAKKRTVDIIFLDIDKAFDMVPHERLLAKLYAYGIRGRLLAWIRSFLQNREQRVVRQS
jgi:hypothetical protein